ncbi:ELOV6 protein, partial [Polyodon spathula]|nr:ELOV6 protein [Polyodon spathula]
MNASEHLPPLQEYDFERSFDEREAIEWMQEHWSKSFVFSALYAAVIFGGQQFMKERQKLELRKPLVLWSLSLAVFSIVGAVRTGWYMLYILDTSGFKQSVCDQSFYSGPVSKFWAYAFVLSKAPELVLLYSWYSYKDRVAGGGWFMTMNYLAHALMYSYYAARAAGVRVPRPLAMLITTMQIAQMVMGLVVSGLVFFWMQDGRCFSYLDNILWASLMYLSYLFLFLSFFYQTYIKGGSSSRYSGSNSSKKTVKED